MRNLVLSLAGLAAIAIATPHAATADTIVVHKYRHPLYNEVVPAPFHHHDDSKTVIIKHHD